MREDIIKAREKSKKDEWEVQMANRKRIIQKQEEEICKETEDLNTQQVLAEQAIKLAELRTKQSHDCTNTCRASKQWK